MTTRKSRTATAVIGVLLSMTIAAPASAAAVPESGRVPPADWKPCGEGNRFDCATVRVPLNYAKPKGPKIGIAVARLRARNPGARIGSLLINPGGPGGSGVRFTFNAETRFSAKLLERFDIVGFDPRGVGASNPVLCDAALLDRYPSTYPATRAEFDAFRAYNRELSTNCRANTGPLFDHVDTISAARDMDMIRAALGERKATFYGVSYGTQLFSQYLELFPGSVRAMTLDSNSEHSETSPLAMIRNYSREFEKAFRQFALWCRRTPGCALGDQDARVVLDELSRRAGRGELTDPDDPTRKLAPVDLTNRMFSELYRPRGWPAAAAWLAALQAQPPGVGGTRAAPPDQLVPFAYQTIVCQDWGWGKVTYPLVERIRRQSAAVAPHTGISPFWSDVIGCVDYQVKVRNPQRPLKVRGAPKILLTNSRYDVATAYFSARRMAAQIPTSTLLTYDGVGHGDYWLSQCAQDAIDTYLVSLQTPPAGTHCAAVWPTVGPQAKDTPELSPPWLIPGVGGGPSARPTVH